MVKRKNKGIQRIVVLILLLLLLLATLLVLIKILKEIRLKTNETANNIAESTTEHRTSEDITTEEQTTEVNTEPATEEPATEAPKEVNLEEIKKYSDEMIPYGIAQGVDADNRPDGCTWYTNKFSDFDVDFIKDNDKKIYLTYMVKKEMGYTEQILDILKTNDVKAVFFITYDYTLNNPKIVQRMIDEGHVIGHGSYMSGTIEDNYKAETMFHNYIMDNYNYNMNLFKIFSDNFNEQQLALVDNMGYKAVFWSSSYGDWKSKQPDADESLKLLLDAAHGGEILMLRTSSSTSLAILQDLLDGFKKKGFEMGYYEGDTYAI